MMKGQFQMHVKHMLISFWMLAGANVYGQPADGDALFAIWADATRPEADRLEAYFTRLNVYKAFQASDPGELKWYEASNEAIELAIKLNRREYLPLLYLALSFNYAVILNDFECACVEANKIIESAEIANASKYALFNASMILFQECSSDVKDADILNEFNKIKSTLSDSHADLLILRHLNAQLGVFYTNKDQYPKALKYILESLRMSEDLELFDARYAGDNQLLAIVHLNIRNYKDAEMYGQKSLSIATKVKDTISIGGSYMLMAKLMVKLKDEKKAQHFVDSAIYVMRDVKQCEDCYNFARIVNAGIKNLSGNYIGALAELNEVEDYFKIVGYAPSLELYIEKANANLGLKKYDDVISILSNSKESEQEYFIAESDKYRILVKAHEAKGEYKQALAYYKKYQLVEDSMAVLRNSSEVTRMDLENQFARQQLKTELEFQTKINKQKATKNLLILLGVGAFLVVMGLLYRLKYIRKTQRLLQKKNEIIEAEKEKAKASERAKHQFLANMSHEIRTPMNAIMGMTDILIRRGPKEEQKEYLNSIKQSSDSLLVIINDILDIAKIESGKVELEHEPFSIPELLNNVHTIMQFKAEEKGLELKKDMPTEDIYVKGDATRLRQILINLIGNAIKFTEKGLVTNTLKVEKADDKLNLHFTVSDTGIGIDKDRMNKIFNSFEQAYADTSRKFGGTGLGLSISKMLVEMQHGKIWVESSKGKGSQFHFTIPYEIAEGTTSEIKPADPNGNIAELLKGIKVLLVEDNQFNAVVAQEELEDAIEGVIVEVAENGAVAVEKLRSVDYDVILMDVQMPKMNGYEATIAIRAFTNEKAGIPIIAMTANVLKEEVDLCYQAGMNDFIGKPFDTNELLLKIYNLKTKTNDKD